MKGWITAVTLIIFMIAGMTVYLLYTAAKDPLEDREQDAVEFARQHVTFQEVESIDYYHGTRAYQIINTQNDEGEHIYIWVEERFSVDEPIIHDDFETDIKQEEEEPRRIIVRKQSDGISKEDVHVHIQDTLSINRLNSVKLGMIGRTPVYEVNYISSEGRQSYYFVTFEEGRYVRHYQF